jgi:hypothetical protein
MHSFRSDEIFDEAADVGVICLGVVDDGDCYVISAWEGVDGGWCFWSSCCGREEGSCLDVGSLTIEPWDGEDLVFLCLKAKTSVCII